MLPKKRTTSAPAAPAAISLDNLPLSTQIAVIFHLFSGRYTTDYSCLNTLLKQHSLPTVSQPDAFDFIREIENTFRLLAKSSAFRKSLLSSQALDIAYPFLQNEYEKEWKNFDTVAWQAYKTSSYALTRLKHSILTGSIQEWESLPEDSAPEQQLAKTLQLGHLENERLEDIFSDNIQKTIDGFLHPDLALKQLSLEVRKQEYPRYSNESIISVDKEYSLGRLKDFLEKDSVPLTMHWTDCFNVLASDILRGDWALGPLLASKVTMTEPIQSFLDYWEALRKGTPETAKSAVETIVETVLADPSQYRANRLSESAMLVLLLGAIWSNIREELHKQLVEYLTKYAHDGVYTTYSYSAPAEGLEYVYEALWDSVNGRKIPAGKSVSWDNLGACTKILRCLALPILPAKYLKEDHLDKMLTMIERFEKDGLHLLAYWCNCQMQLLPILGMSSGIRKGIQACKETVAEYKKTHPDWFSFSLQGPQKNEDTQLVDALRRILNISKATVSRKSTTAATATKRIAWIFVIGKNFCKENAVVDIIPRQYVAKGGTWEIGSGMARTSLGGKTQFDLTQEENRMFQILDRFSPRAYGYECTTLTSANMPLIPKLRHVFTVSDGYVNNGRISDNAIYTPAHFELTQVQLAVEEQKDGAFVLRLPELNVQSSVILRKLADGKYEILNITKPIRELYNLFKILGGPFSLKLTPQIVKELPGLVEALGQHFQLNAHLTENTLQALPTAKGGVALVLRVHVQGSTYQLGLFNRPLMDEKLLVVPGSGAEQFNCTVKGVSSILLRDLSGERKAKQQFLQTFPDLEPWATNHCTWEIPDADTMLPLLETLYNIEKPFFTLEWDNSRPVNVLRPLSWKNITLKATGNDWFEFGKDIAVDESHVLTLQQLFSLSRTTCGNFLQLDDSTYVRLTSMMRRQLQSLSVFSRETNGKTCVSNAALPLISTFYTSESEVPDAISSHLKQLHKSVRLKPKTPSNLQADLRPYQLDGFIWMRRLAECGLGCCLADDMGIGKTLQAITLLLDLASQGPSLVVAPASLQSHWQSECQRFAPMLKTAIFGGSEQERQDILKNASDYSVIIVTYGCLQTSLDAFLETKWNCVILDEAQAIKNKDTKRTKASKQLQCRFRLALSGTPVENNLLELWSIFDFLNPGMLGNEKQFQEKMSEGDSMMPALKRAVSPLLLRRTKAEVLSDLPEKTEIQRTITLPTQSREEYEALRRNAQVAISTSAQDNRIEILAQLTKLRSFCCHPSLVGIQDSSSPKLDTLLELVADLKKSGHRTLIFSQFVRFLDIVRKEFDLAQYKYQYLDGSTPPAQRSGIVDAFNHGDGDFFLISLKAGGLGLNLATADFVILLDSWWNPAVENQAIDRAHRIGQTRPVTVYRLVCADTIEEKIIDLHAKKLHLTDDIFDENQTASLKLEELKALL